MDSIFYITGQKMTVKQPFIVADTIDYLTCKFHFNTDDWEGLTKYAHFTRKDKTYDVLLTDDAINESDGLNLTAGKWEVSVHGNIVEGTTVRKRITTNTVEIRVFKSGVLEGEPFPTMTASVGEQYAAKCTEQANIAVLQAENAESSANDAGKSASNAIQSAETASEKLNELEEKIATGKFKGNDGYSPKVTTSKTGTVTTIEITDSEGIKTATINDGVDGKDGKDGTDADVTEENVTSALGYKPTSPAELDTKVDKVSGKSLIADTEIDRLKDVTNYDDTELKADVAAKLTKPTTCIVGQYFRVASIDNEGNPVLECVDAKTVGVQDVQINGSSVLTDGAANISLGNTLVKNSDNSYDVHKADASDISGRTANTFLQASDIDTIVKDALTDGKGADWTADEQQAAKDRLNINSGSEKSGSGWEEIFNAALTEETQELTFELNNASEILLTCDCRSASKLITNAYVQLNDDESTKSSVSNDRCARVTTRITPLVVDHVYQTYASDTWWNDSHKPINVDTITKLYLHSSGYSAGTVVRILARY